MILPNMFVESMIYFPHHNNSQPDDCDDAKGNEHHSHPSAFHRHDGKLRGVQARPVGGPRDPGRDIFRLGSGLSWACENRNEGGEGEGGGWEWGQGLGLGLGGRQQLGFGGGQRHGCCRTPAWRRAECVLKATLLGFNPPMGGGHEALTMFLNSGRNPVEGHLLVLDRIWLCSETWWVNKLRVHEKKTRKKEENLYIYFIFAFHIFVL